MTKAHHALAVRGDEFFRVKMKIVGALESKSVDLS